MPAEKEYFSGCCYEPMSPHLPISVCPECGKFCDVVDNNFDSIPDEEETPDPTSEWRHAYAAAERSKNELLVALKKIVTSFEATMETLPSSTPEPQVITEARAAIARAEGTPY
jgi:hypothetical protein